VLPGLYSLLSPVTEACSSIEGGGRGACVYGCVCVRRGGGVQNHLKYTLVDDLLL
jgi:hypothetical protein